MASRQGHLEMVNLLLDSGFDFSVADDYGQTPLLAACKADRPFPEIVQILFDRGADIPDRNIEVGPRLGDKPRKLYFLIYRISLTPGAVTPTSFSYFSTLVQM